ncbi:18401_t:CDS:2 [Acaulospora morrowiae]|uniref:18401_t:CDS:1 n=1 Tax=Acaulospora morrowiae TaxID=94023 RepID=A0A9N9CIJ0_9GLOM|nr:18401_t:CDS:2 [Acaulospora morrowiae]
MFNGTKINIAILLTKVQLRSPSVNPFLQKALFTKFHCHNSSKSFSTSQHSEQSDTKVDQDKPHRLQEKNLLLWGHESESAFDDYRNTQDNLNRKTVLNQAEPPEKEPKGSDDYTLNVGRAIRTLRSDLSLFFEHGLTDTSVYSQNILLSDPYHTGLHVRGKHVYIGIANLLRWSLVWYFDDLTLEILKIHVVDNDAENGSGHDEYFKDPTFDDTLGEKLQNSKKVPLSRDQITSSELPIQSSNRNRNTRLFIRWSLEGTPRSSYIFSMFSSRSTRIPRSTFSGVFMYKFDLKNGLISEHHVKNIIPAPSRRAVLYQGFGGLGGLLWRIRSGMRQKNEWGVGNPNPELKYKKQFEIYLKQKYPKAMLEYYI